MIIIGTAGSGSVYEFSADRILFRIRPAPVIITRIVHTLISVIHGVYATTDAIADKCDLILKCLHPTKIVQFVLVGTNDIAVPLLTKAYTSENHYFC